MSSIDQVKAGWSAHQLEQYETGRAAALTAAEAGYVQLDTNGDGAIDKEELINVSKQGMPNADPAKIEEQCREFFAQFDANNDGKVQKEEWLTYFGQMFDKVIVDSM